MSRPPRVTASAAPSRFWMTPCVDVVLLLFFLHFFASTASRHELEPVPLPRARYADPLDADDRALELTMDRDGRVTVQGRILTLRKLEDLFEARRPRSHGTVRYPLRLRADRRVDFGHVRAVLDIARRYGRLDQVELIVMRPSR